jgi:hypothetical protein
MAVPAGAAADIPIGRDGRPEDNSAVVAVAGGNSPKRTIGNRLGSDRVTSDTARP